jgi:hypothetical protein
MVSITIVVAWKTWKMR